MNLTTQISRHFREVYFGENWSASNLKDNLAGLTWQQATTRLHDFNSIATLVFHINYYVAALLKVLEGGLLDAHDKYSFNHPPIQSQKDWENMLEKSFANADKFAALVEQLPDQKLWENVGEEKYGNYYRNIHGIIEHAHYHLGQIVLLKKILLKTD